MNCHRQKLIDTITSADAGAALILLRVSETHTNMERINCSTHDSMNGALALLHRTLIELADSDAAAAFASIVQDVLAGAWEPEDTSEGGSHD